MNKYIDAGIVQFMAYPEVIKGEGPIEETIKKILVDDYFNAIEITWIKDKDVRKKVAKMLETSKIKVGYGAQPRLLTTGLNLNHLDDNERLKAVASLRDAIDEAYELHATAIGFLSGHYEEDTKEESYEALLKSVKELCSYADTKGIKMLLEIFDFDIDKKSLIGPTLLAKRFAEDITKEHQNFGLIVDLSHVPMYYESYKESLEPIKDFIAHIHVGNTVIKDEKFDAYGDAHPRFGFPNGENDVDELTKFLQELVDIDYIDGKEPKIISFEVKPFKDEDSDLVVANAKRTLNKAWLNVKTK